MSKINLEDFKVMRQIGEGSFGKIYLVEEINTKNLYTYYYYYLLVGLLNT